MDMRRDVHGFNPLGSEEGTYSSNNVGDGEKRTSERVQKKGFRPKGYRQRHPQYLNK